MNDQFISIYNIEDLDMFIHSNKPGYSAFIPFDDLDNGKKIFALMKEKEGPLCEMFGTGDHGYTNYVLYKAQNGQTYVISIFIHTPKSYSIVNDESWFHYSRYHK
jgi:hypothetical protein